MRGRDERLAEVASGEDRRALVEHAAEVVDASLADEFQGGSPLRSGHVVQHAKLVVLAEP